jgi:hypothetical protein
VIALLLPLLFAAAASPADHRPSDPILRTLVEGEAAQAQGDTASLGRKARVLSVLGAAPAPGQADLAALWREKAQASGAIIDDPPYRGRALGPAYRRGSLLPGGSMTMRQLFLGGQRAHIMVAPTGEGDGHLSLKVQGAKGETLCEKPVGGPQADCAWMPLFTDRYHIVIENDGEEAVSFYLLVR